MMGRAGRPRYDPYGEAVLLVKSSDMKEACEEAYLRGPPEAITSKLAADAALRIHSLASIAGGYCDSDASLARFFGHTFWAQEADDWVLRDRIEDVMWFLEDNGFVERDGERLKATLLGKRTSDLYIDPLSALRMRKALQAQAEPTAFGLLQIVSGCPDVYPLYLRQSDAEWVQQAYYAHFPELLVPDEGDLEAALSYTKTALLLHDWIEEASLRDLEQKYKLGPGDIRLRLDTAGWLLHALRELARALRPDWQRRVSDVGIRLEHGIREELLQVVRLKGIGRVRARTLWSAGLRTTTDIAKAPIDRLAGLPGFGRRSAEELLKQVGALPKGDRATSVTDDDGANAADGTPDQGAVAGTPPVADASGRKRAQDGKGQVRLSAFDRP